MPISGDECAIASKLLGASVPPSLRPVPAAGDKALYERGCVRVMRNYFVARYTFAELFSMLAPFARQHVEPVAGHCG
ncbi:unnamed protein product, partial [Iphiclides podalirius]